MFGDSWAWGDELVDPELVDGQPWQDQNRPYRERHCYAGVLGKRLACAVENLAWPGSSLQSMIWTYLWWLENEILDLDRCLVLVGLTEPSRHSWYNPRHVSYADDPPWNRFMHGLWVRDSGADIDPEWRQLWRLHTAITACDELDRLNYLQALHFFSPDRGHPRLIFNTYPARSDAQVPGLVPGNCRDVVTDEPGLLAPNGHPNAQGHLRIADYLATYLDQNG